MRSRNDVLVSPEEAKKQKDISNKIKNFLCEKRLNLKAFIETYGCQQNVNDSEILAGMLTSMGFEITENKDEADLILYNTCAVRENAELKVFGNLGALKHIKAKKPDLIIGVCGCMMQQESIQKQIKQKYKHVDMVFGTHSLYSFPELLSYVIEDRQRVFDIQDIDGRIAEELPVLRKKGACAWVSIMYGCNNFCTYCIVPYVRGRERSRDSAEILKEITRLAGEGYKEVTLLGQNVNSYGNDFEPDENGNKTDFADLLKMVCKIDGIERVRFMTSHPKDISDKLIDTMASEPKICKQLHLPVQAGSNSVLKAMNRRYTKEDYLAKVEKIRQKMPDIVLTTDIIVGFPGESNEDFKETIDVLEKARYDSVFSFIYSKRPGTPASKMEDCLSVAEKKKNFNKLLEVQDRISKEINDTYEGKVLKVLAEGPSKTNPDVLAGRTDGGKTVNFKGNESHIGKMLDVKITEAKTWSLIGEIVE